MNTYKLANKLFDLLEAQTYCKMRDNLENVLIDGQVNLTQIAEELDIWWMQQ